MSAALTDPPKRGDRAGGGRRIDRAMVVVEALVGLGVVVAIVGKSYGLPSTISFALCGLAVAATSYFLLRMFSSLSDEALDVPDRIMDEERARLEHEKMLLLQGIKEFDADAATGKVDQADYEELRSTAEARALEIIRSLKESDAFWMREAEQLVRDRLGAAAAKTREPAPVERAVVAPVAEAADGHSVNGANGATAIAGVFDDRPVSFAPAAEALRCEACDQKNDPDARYCIGCGRPRTVEGARA